MISRTRGIFSGNIWKPKNIHSVEYLKYLYTVLNKNQNVTEQNKELLVEVIRMIAEILIWGDQNDSSVIDFFLEKNILSFFLKFMRHKNGKMICNQLLQTLSIIFENISDNTSIYYLLSNNHINSIICHKFDFTDEEVMAYYISFLKALSMKLNKHTINFFYNEHTEDFALYTEAIKFFNQTEFMVRTAVRVITLNVYKVADKPMLRYIRDKTAGPYFRSLVWSIGTHVLDIDSCLRKEAEPYMDSKLQSFIDEHLDNLHYVNDILCLNVDILNEILIDSLLNKFIIPLYVYSLTKRRVYSPDTDDRPHINHSLALYLLAQIYIIIKHPHVVDPLARIILTGDLGSCAAAIGDSEDPLLGSFSEEEPPAEPVEPVITEFTGPTRDGNKPNSTVNVRFDTNIESLSQLLDNIKGKARPRSKEFKSQTMDDSSVGTEECDSAEVGNSTKEERQQQGRFSHSSAPVTPRYPRREPDTSPPWVSSGSSSAANMQPDEQAPQHNPDNIDNIEQKQLSLALEPQDTATFSLEGRPFLKTIFRCLTIDEEDTRTNRSDYDVLFALCLLFTMCHNQGVSGDLLRTVGLTSKCNDKQNYNHSLLDKFMTIFNCSVKYATTVRLVTIELMCILVEILACSRTCSFISDEHFAFILTAKEESTLLLRNYYKSEGVFVDMFEEEYLNLRKRPLNVEFLMMDSSILVPHRPEVTSKVTDLTRRLPVNDVEHARYAIRVFLLLRQLCERVRTQEDAYSTTDSHDNSTDVPVKPTCRNSYLFDSDIVSVGDKLDLTNRDLVACSFEVNGKAQRRFLVTDDQQIILVEPDSKKVGWGVVVFVGFLQHVQLTAVRDDKRSLQVSVYDHRGAIALKTSKVGSAVVSALLAARFTFDDHIRCMVAQKRLERGREQAQQTKLCQIALMLDFPSNVALAIKPTANNSNREYRSGYYGPKENSTASPRSASSIVINSSANTSTESANSSSLQVSGLDSPEPGSTAVVTAASHDSSSSPSYSAGLL